MKNPILQELYAEWRKQNPDINDANYLSKKNLELFWKFIKNEPGITRQNGPDFIVRDAHGNEFSACAPRPEPLSSWEVMREMAKMLENMTPEERARAYDDDWRFMYDL